METIGNAYKKFEAYHIEGTKLTAEKELLLNINLVVIGIEKTIY